MDKIFKSEGFSEALPYHTERMDAVDWQVGWNAPIDVMPDFPESDNRFRIMCTSIKPQMVNRCELAGGNFSRLEGRTFVELD